MSEATVSAGLARGLMDFAASRGADLQKLVSASGISPDDLEDADSRVPFANYQALVRAADAMVHPALHVQFAEAIDMSEYSVVGLLTYASETMAQSLAQLNRYGQLVIEVDIGADGRFAMSGKDGGLWMVDMRKNANDFPELTETTFTRFTVGPRRFLPFPHVLEINFTHAAPSYRDEIERIFQCPVKFGADWNAMRLDPRVPAHRVQMQPRYVFGILSEHADALLKDLEASKTTRGRVEALLMPVLHTGEVSMDDIAKAIGQSRQTLYRNLKAEDVTFEQVLDELRHKLALHYLSGKKVSVNETAYLVGFSDPAAFSRAFKRWTGKTPRDVRNAP